MARFRGAPTYDLMVTNVAWEAATKDYSYVTFDLSWGHSWRAKWVEPAATSVTGKDLEVESWDAVWVFVKFLPKKDSRESIERNHWLHASLAMDASEHVMPAGATHSVKLSDDGTRGMGVFIYRDAVGQGPNKFKGIKLRWMHGAGKVDPAKAGLRVYPISMVYVPEGPFKVGSGADSGFTQFPDGPTVPVANGDYMSSMNVAVGSRTDGSWRGGPVVPFLVDAEWNGPVAEGTRARRVGAKAGQLWSVLTYNEYWVNRPSVGSTGVLNDEYPTGYEAFYCMKYDLTQGQYTDFLNALPPDVAAGRAFVSDEVGCDYPLGSEDVKIPLDFGPDYLPAFIREKAGLTITVSTLVSERRSSGLMKAKLASRGQDGGLDPEASDDLVDSMLGEIDRTEKAVEENQKTRPPPVYSARLPFRACSGISRDDMYAYGVWSGLRPMTELEIGKAGQGPRNPAPFENNTVTNYGMADSLKDLVDVGLPTERYARGNHAGGYGSPLTVFRVGCFATPTSDQLAAGASYWGILELGARVISVLNRDYRGTHGDGITSAGKPGGSIGRHLAPFDGPEDWPTRTWEYYSGRWVWCRGRLVISAGNRIKKAAPQPAPAMAKPSPATAAPSPDVAPADRVADAITISNITCEPGTKGTSTISFDLAWSNSWRAIWTEPADKNVTGKPLRLESWDAAWVFIKFRPAGMNAFSHAMVSPEAADHGVPTGAKLDVGLSDDGTKGVGVFIYRSAVGSGANDFKNIKLRWLHGADKAPDKATFKDSQLRAHTIGMVYVPRGQFQSRVPWEKAVTTIRLGDATQEGGCRVATNTPVYAECPNGFNAFYSTKYAISQGQYAEYLNSQGPARGGPGLYGISRYMIRCDTNAEVYVAEVPDRGCNFMGWQQILNYEAWAGLRPLTDLEYEKACRGPRAVARSEDAWADGMCAPAAGLSPLDGAQGRKELFPDLPDIDAGASYWGIRGLSLSGCVHEWPGIIFENERGKGFKGTHGEGHPVLPTDWPGTSSLWVRDVPFGAVATWVSPDDIDRAVALGEGLAFMCAGRYGARAVRTAAAQQDSFSPLQMTPVPAMRGVDIGIFYLSGHFRNEGDKPVRVELVTPLPDSCFPEGAASRAFTAAPKAVTPFQVLTVLTRHMATRALQSGRSIPVRLRMIGGDVLADQFVDPGFRPDPQVGGDKGAIISIDGGDWVVRTTNMTDRAVALAIELQPPKGLTVDAITRRLDVAAHAGAGASFSVPRQAFTANGLCTVPYRVTVAEGMQQDGELVTDLRVMRRWWIARRIVKTKTLDTLEPDLEGANSLGGAVLSNLSNYDSGVFKTRIPLESWTRTTCGVTLTLGQAAYLPSHGSSIQAVTRVESPEDREAVVELQHDQGKGIALFDFTVWVNGAVVFKQGADRTVESKPFQIRKTGNTMVMECRSADNGAVTPGAIYVGFKGVTDGQPLSDLHFDMEKPGE